MAILRSGDFAGGVSRWGHQRRYGKLPEVAGLNGPSCIMASNRDRVASAEEVLPRLQPEALVILLLFCGNAVGCTRFNNSKSSNCLRFRFLNSGRRSALGTSHRCRASRPTSSTLLRPRYTAFFVWPRKTRSAFVASRQANTSRPMPCLSMSSRSPRAAKAARIVRRRQFGPG